MSLPARRPRPWLASDRSPRPRAVRSGAEADAVIAALAARQAGTVARWQLLAAGLTAAMIASRLRRLLHVVRPGVYAVGQRALAPAARYWIEVLACGPAALLGGWAAMEFMGLVTSRPRSPITVVVPPPVQRRPAGVRVRRLRVARDETTTVDGMRLMTVPRAILEVAATHGPGDAERAWRGAVHHGVLDVDAVTSVVERHDGEAGAKTVAALLERRRELLGRSETGLEERVARLAARAGLPAPARNRRVVLTSGRVVVFDLCLPDLGLAIEADGPHHDDPEVRAEDARRDADAARDGWRTVRAAHDERDAVIVARFAAAHADVLHRAA